MTHILLVGNPNCGKTTLFNALTGDNQKVGNWSGVTVEKKTGVFAVNQQTITVTDLPGIYSLTVVEGASGLDEGIATQAIASCSADLIINVVDACHLERHLYLTSQLLERGLPVIVALSMNDIALLQGISIDSAELSKALGCPVIALTAHKKMGCETLKQAIISLPLSSKPNPLSLALDATTLWHVEKYTEQFMHYMGSHGGEGCWVLARYYALRTLEGDMSLSPDATPSFQDRVLPPEIDIVLADARYQEIHQIVNKVQKKKSAASEQVTAKIDKVVLHRFWALPLFLMVMYGMFLFAINIGGAFQDFFDISTTAIFVEGGGKLLNAVHAPAWLIALSHGFGVGVNTTLTFVPVIASMYFFLSFLEISGYMARAAFVVDKLMRVLGLPGKAFVPMIVGFGCNVPAVMAARTLDTERDRILTIIMSPFMSCSARLAIYAVFVAAFFPTGGQNVVFSLYMTGIVMAVLTGFMLRKTSLRGEPSPLILELPTYHRPTMARLCKETVTRLMVFIKRAAKIIIPVCIVLDGLNALSLDGSFNAQNASIHSVLSNVGQWMTPLFSPMGITADNWPATVGLATGMLAKEVVIGSLNTLYTEVGHLGQIGVAGFDFPGALMAALQSIVHNFKELGSAFLNPIVASAPSGEISQSVYGIMVQRFDGQAGAFAYLLFVLLYIPCVSTMAVIRQETQKRWMYFSLLWSLLLAYAVAVVFYQIARFSLHPGQSLFWIALMVFMLSSFVAMLRLQAIPLGVKHVTANS